MLPLLGILTAIFVGWIWKKESMKAELTAQGGIDRKTYPVIRFLLRYVCPILVSVVLVFGIMDFVKGLNSAPVDAEPVATELQSEPVLAVEGVETLGDDIALPEDSVTLTVLETE
jgi:hypothetical protein